jgi:hypothetical protein
MRRTIELAGIFILLAVGAAAQTPIDVVPVKEMKPTGNLSTCSYVPSEQEKPFYEKLAPEERTTGSFSKRYDVHKKKGTYIGWYGVVRGITRPAAGDGHWQLLLEHKYFDGMTDCHIMLVSMSGSGDFRATVREQTLPIPALALVRVYGHVVRGEEGTPVIEADFVRVWPWMTFTFTDLGGEDKSNPRWRSVCKICQGRIYKPYPTEQYYRDVLGDPKDYGEALQ